MHTVAEDDRWTALETKDLYLYGRTNKLYVALSCCHSSLSSLSTALSGI